jgi:hypothetical protein
MLPCSLRGFMLNKTGNNFAVIYFPFDVFNIHRAKLKKYALPHISISAV